MNDEFGGVIDDLGGVAKNAPPVGVADGENGGGDAGDGGPPLEVPGGLIRFSF